MAIDSLRKRASIASLGLAFLGPSVVPDGSLGNKDFQVVANSYYGIQVAAATHTIGGTSQLGAFDSSGAIKVGSAITLGGTSQLEAYDSSGGLNVQTQLTLGGTSQLEAYDSTGGITVITTHTIGDTSQLGPFTSSGFIQVGEARTGGQKGPITVGKKRKKAKKKEEYYTSEAFLKKVQSGKIELNGVEVFLDEPIDVPVALHPTAEIASLKDEVFEEIAQIMIQKEVVGYEIEKTKYLQEIKKLEEQALFVMFVLLSEDF